MSFPLLTVILFMPLLGAIVVWLMPKEKEQLIRWFSAAISLIPLALSIYLWIAYTRSPGGVQFEEVYRWIPALKIQYHLGVDGLSVPLIFLTALLSTLAFYYSSFTIKVRVKEYYLFFMLLQMGMLGVFMSLDFVLFYVFWEIGLVPMYFLIGIWGGARREYAAIKFFLYTLIGSVAMLLAILYVYFNVGSFDILEATEKFRQVRPFLSNIVPVSLAFWAFFVGFAIKVPSFPFHTWLPDAHTEAPTAGSVILAGVLLKLGAYGMLRILLPIFPEAFSQYAWIVGILAVVSIVYGAFVCMAQWDLKRLIAYSSVSHMGYVMLGIAAAAAAVRLPGEEVARSASIALNGAVLQMFNHGIITGGLFFLVGIIYEQAHTRELKAFGGLSGKLPYYYGVFAVTAFASLGLPGLAGFWAEFMVFRGAFAIIPVYAVIGALGIVVTAAYILWKIMQYMFLGTFDQERWGGKLRDMALFEKVTMWPLLLFMFAIGFYPAFIVNLINGATTALVGGF
jgi:NADH-quinone oxidoreductase subunit M